MDLAHGDQRGAAAPARRPRRGRLRPAGRARRRSPTSGAEVARPAALAPLVVLARSPRRRSTAYLTGENCCESDRRRARRRCVENHEECGEADARVDAAARGRLRASRVVHWRAGHPRWRPRDGAPASALRRPGRRGWRSAAVARAGLRRPHRRRRRQAGLGLTLGSTPSVRRLAPRRRAAGGTTRPAPGRPRPRRPPRRARTPARRRRACSRAGSPRSLVEVGERLDQVAPARRGPARTTGCRACRRSSPSPSGQREQVAPTSRCAGRAR